MHTSSERSQSEKTTNCTIPFIWYSEKGKAKTDGKQIRSFKSLKGGGMSR
jgi:hypothetical protein